MRSSSAADARPVRTELNSWLIVSTVLSMRRVASWISSSIVIAIWSLRGVGGGDDRADALAVDDPADVAARELEDVDRQAVVHAERESRRVHHPEPPLDRLQVGQLGQEPRVRVGARVAVVDALDAVLRHED